MKRFLDYWIMYLYHFVLYIKPGDSTPWVSAIIYLGLFVFSFFMNIFLGILLFLIHQQINHEFIEITRVLIKPIWIGLGVLCMVGIGILYRKDSHEKIEESYKRLTRKKRYVVKMCIYVSEIGLPVLLFILARLFLDGYIF